MSKAEAANIVGTAKRKENSMAVFLSSPVIKPPMIEAADLDTPGIIDTDCAKPIIKAFLRLILSKDCVSRIAGCVSQVVDRLRSPDRKLRLSISSNRINRIPPKNKAITTTREFPKR